MDDAVVAHQRRRARCRGVQNALTIAPAAGPAPALCVRVCDAAACDASVGAATHSAAVQPAVDYYVVVGAATRGVPGPAAIVDRYPRTDRPDAPLAPLVRALCFPNGVAVHRAPQPRPPRFFAFVLTEADGTRTYGAVAVVDEPIPETSSETSSETAFEEKALCLVSRQPLFGALRACLARLWRIVAAPSRVSYAAAVRALVDRVPAPLPGGLPVRVPPLPGTPDAPIVLRCAAPTRLAAPGCAVRPLLDTVGVHAAVQLVAALLLERRVLFFARDAARLVAAQEALRALLHPFAWPHVYIPVVGTVLADFLHAPTPFLMGVLRAPALALPPLPDVVTCDLDTGATTFPAPVPVPAPLHALAAAWLRVLHPHLARPCPLLEPGAADAPSATEALPLPLPPPRPSTDLFVEDATDAALRRCALETFVRIFHDYRQHIYFFRKYPCPVVWFARTEFVAALGQAQAHALEPFLSAFFDTQAFNLFYEAAALQHPNLFDRACFLYNTHGGLLSLSLNPCVYDVALVTWHSAHEQRLVLRCCGGSWTRAKTMLVVACSTTSHHSSRVQRRRTRTPPSRRCRPQTQTSPPRSPCCATRPSRLPPSALSPTSCSSRRSPRPPTSTRAPRRCSARPSAPSSPRAP